MHRVKILLLGDEDSGKSSALQAYLNIRMSELSSSSEKSVSSIDNKTPKIAASKNLTMDIPEMPQFEMTVVDTNSCKIETLRTRRPGLHRSYTISTKYNAPSLKSNYYSPAHLFRSIISPFLSTKQSFNFEKQRRRHSASLYNNNNNTPNNNKGSLASIKIRQDSYPLTNCILIFFDCSSKNWKESILFWENEVKTNLHLKKKPIIYVASKTDKLLASDSQELDPFVHNCLYQKKIIENNSNLFGGHDFIEISSVRDSFNIEYLFETAGCLGYRQMMGDKKITLLRELEKSKIQSCASFF